MFKKNKQKNKIKFKKEGKSFKLKKRVKSKDKQIIKLRKKNRVER